VPELDGLSDASVAADEDVLAGDLDATGNVVVLGSARRALVTALFCAERGAAVTVVDHDLLRPAHDASALMRRSYKQQLAAAGIEVVPAPVLRLRQDSVVLEGRELLCDLLVLSLRLRSVREAREVVPDGVAHTVIGDANEPRSIMDAISEAREAVDRIHEHVSAGAPGL
jgi:hypothetical protein